MGDHKDKTTLFTMDSYPKRSIFISRLNKQRLTALADFFSEGLGQGNLCIAITTPRHRRFLNKQLRARGIDVESAAEREQYYAIDTVGTLPGIDLSADTDKTAYHRALERISALVAQDKQRVRAFGELTG